MRLGERIQKIRNENGFSQEQLAEKLHVSNYLVKESNDKVAMEELDNVPRKKYKMAVNKIAGITMMSVSGISLMLFWIISIFNPCTYWSDNYNGDGTFIAFLLSYNVTSLFLFCWMIGIIGIILFFRRSIQNK